MYHLKPHRLNGPQFQGILGTEPNCTQCPLRFKRKVLPNGPVPAKIAIVAEGPGKQEELKGIGLCGPSGRLLWEGLGSTIGLRRQSVWVSNAHLCRPCKVRLSSNVVLDMEEVKRQATACCRIRLLSELAAVDPVVIIPLGAFALQSIQGFHKASIYAYRGSIMETNIHDVYYKALHGLE